MLAERARRGLHHFIGVGAALQRVGVGNQAMLRGAPSWGNHQGFQLAHRARRDKLALVAV